MLESCISFGDTKVVGVAKTKVQENVVKGSPESWGVSNDICTSLNEDRRMVGNFPVITLCGSTKFKDQFLEVQKRLTLKGNIVISVGLFGHSGDEEVWSPGIKAMLDDMHKRKIDMADAIYVINVGGYIGESTRSEIEYARNNGKHILFLENQE